MYYTRYIVYKHIYMTNAKIEVHHFFSEVPRYGRSRPLPKTDVEKKI